MHLERLYICFIRFIPFKFLWNLYQKHTSPIFHPFRTKFYQWKSLGEKKYSFISKILNIAHNWNKLRQLIKPSKYYNKYHNYSMNYSFLTLLNPYLQPWLNEQPQFSFHPGISSKRSSGSKKRLEKRIISLTHSTFSLFLSLF